MSKLQYWLNKYKTFEISEESELPFFLKEVVVAGKVENHCFKKYFLARNIKDTSPSGLED